MGRIPRPRLAPLLGVVAALVLAGAPAAHAEVGLDASYGEEGFVGPLAEGSTQMAASGDGIVVVGKSGSQIVATRYDAGGLLDGAYGQGGVSTQDFGGGTLDAAVGHPDGRVSLLISRTETSRPFNSHLYVARLTPGGALDPGFGSGGVLELSFGSVSDRQGVDLAVDHSGRLLVLAASQGTVYVLRAFDGGQLDGSFGDDGIAAYGEPGFFEYPAALAATADGGACSYGGSAVAGDGERRAVICFDAAGDPSLVSAESSDASAFANDIAALPSGGVATLYGTPVTELDTSTFLMGSSLLGEPISFEGFEAGSWTNGASLTAAGPDAMLAAGSAGTTFANAKPAFFLLGSSGPSGAPLESWQMLEGPWESAQALDVLSAGDGAFIAWLLSYTEEGPVSYLARIRADAAPGPPRDRDSLTLGRLRMPDTVGGLLRRGARVSAVCSSDCRVDLKLKLPRGLSKRLGLDRRLVDRYRGHLDGGRKYLVRMPVKGRVARRIVARFVGPTTALRLRVGSRARFDAG